MLQEANLSANGTFDMPLLTGKRRFSIWLLPSTFRPWANMRPPTGSETNVVTCTPVACDEVPAVRYG